MQVANTAAAKAVAENAGLSEAVSKLERDSENKRLEVEVAQAKAHAADREQSVLEDQLTKKRSELATLSASTSSMKR